MRFQTRSRHVIDFIFPIALFFVFAASSLVVLILAADIYGSTTNQLQANDENRTALAYISEKIRQNDAGGAPEIATVEGIECLALTADYNDVPHTTYIYEYEGMLKELFARDDASVSLKDGKDIMEISSLTILQIDDRLYQFITVDSQDREDSLVVSERSVQ